MRICVIHINVSEWVGLKIQSLVRSVSAGIDGRRVAPRAVERVCSQQKRIRVHNCIWRWKPVNHRIVAGFCVRKQESSRPTGRNVTASLTPLQAPFVFSKMKMFVISKPLYFLLLHWHHLVFGDVEICPVSGPDPAPHKHSKTEFFQVVRVRYRYASEIVFICM